MNKNNLQKKIGIVLGVITMLGVLYVNIFWGKNSSAPASQTLPNTSGVNPSTPVTPLSKTPAPVTKSKAATSPKQTIYYGDDEGEGIYYPASPTPPTPAPVTVTPPPATVPKKTTASVYRDGTYSITVSYMSPGGYDQLGVSLVLKNDTVTDGAVTDMAGDNRSARYQDGFISQYRQYVIGQPISGLSLSRVAGASLTTRAFNDALNQVRAQAKA